eukprot:c47535_g1_i1 orf=624-1943(+)
MNPSRSASFHPLKKDDKATLRTQESHRLSKLIVKGLCIALIISLSPFVVSHCLPLLKLVGALLLRRLWNILNFVILTTAVSAGIINSRRKELERNRSEVHKFPTKKTSLLVGIFGDVMQSEREVDSSRAIDQILEATESSESTGPGAGSSGGDTKRGEAAISCGSIQNSTLGNDGVQARKLVTSLSPSETRISNFSFMEGIMGMLRKSPITRSKDQAIAGAQVDSRVDLPNRLQHFGGEKGSSSRSFSHGNHNFQDSNASTSNTEDNSQAQVPADDRKSHKRSYSLDQSHQKSVQSDKQSSCDDHVDENGMKVRCCKTQSMPTARRRNVSFSFSSGEPEHDLAKRYEPYQPPPFASRIDSKFDQSSSLNTTGSSSIMTGESSPLDIKPCSVTGHASEEMGSSPDELNRKAEAFIAKFHEQQRLQRMESLEKFMQRLGRA